jgi:hypothetical protein
MADGEMMRVSAAQLARISEVTKARERTKIAEEIDGHAAVEMAMGNIEISEKLTILAESIRPQKPIVKKKLTPEEARREGERLIVPGMESLPFAGYDAGLVDDGLPPVREHSDEDDAVALARKFG